MISSSLLTVRHLSLEAPGGRPLIRDLAMSLGRGERVALVGRNGVGKSALLEVRSKSGILPSRSCTPERVPGRFGSDSCMTLAKPGRTCCCSTNPPTI